MTIWMSIRTVACQIRGKVSRGLLNWKKKPPKDVCGPGGDWQKFKRLPDQITCGQRYGRKLVKPLRTWKNKHGKTRSQNSTIRLRGIYFINPVDQDYKETPKHVMRKLERPVAAMTCKRKVRTSTTKVAAKQEIASQKIPKTISGCMVESHESTRQRVESSPLTKHEDRIASKGFASMTHYNFVWFTHHSYAPSDEHAGCKSCSGQGMEKSRDNPSITIGECQEQERWLFWKHKETHESPLCYTAGHISPQKMRS